MHIWSHVLSTLSDARMQIPKEYIPGVVKGLEEMMGSGILAGFPVVDLCCTLYDGGFHDVDSSVLAFQIAARAAFRHSPCAACALPDMPRVALWQCSRPSASSVLPVLSGD